MHVHNSGEMGKRKGNGKENIPNQNEEERKLRRLV